MQSKENKITSCEKDNYLCTQWKQRKQGQLKKNSIQVIQMKRTAAPGRSVKSQSPQTKKYLNHPS